MNNAIQLHTKRFSVILFLILFTFSLVSVGYAFDDSDDAYGGGSGGRGGGQTDPGDGALGSRGDSSNYGGIDNTRSDECSGNCSDTVNIGGRDMQLDYSTGNWHSVGGPSDGSSGGGSVDPYKGDCPPGYRLYEWGDSEKRCDRIAPPPPPPATANINLSAGTVFEGDEITITWSSSNAPSCSSIGFSTGGDTSGSVVIVVTETTTYTLICGSAQRSATATVLIPDLSITADPSTVHINNATDISWSATGVTSCGVSEDNPDFVDSWSGTSGTQATSPITGETIYTLLCQTIVRAISENVKVKLVPIFEEF